MDSSDNGEEDADDAIEEDGRQISWSHSLSATISLPTDTTNLSWDESFLNSALPWLLSNPPCHVEQQQTSKPRTTSRTTL